MLVSNCSWIPWWQRPQVCGHVLAVDARERVGPRQHGVGGVAARAGGGDGEAALQQALAVDALGVGLDDLVLRPLVAHRRLLALAVAARAQPGHVRGEGRRGGLQPAEDAVGAVALLAGRGVLVPGEQQLAVLARRVLLGHLGVAGAAVHLLRDRLAGPSQRDVDARVALRAGDPGVTRALVLRLVHEQRPAVLRHEALLLVAPQAVRVRHALAVEDLPHLVRLVAVDARGQHVRLLLPQLAPDDLAVHRLDLGVALRAGARDVAARDRGAAGRCAAGCCGRCGRRRSWRRR